MNYFVRTLFCGLVILLTGCMHYQSFIQHSQAKLTCKLLCKQRLMRCNMVCDNSCAHCCVSARQRAAREFNLYEQQQKIQGRSVVRQLNSYRDPLQCRKTTCECSTDYQTCIQTCAGKIPKRLQVAPGC